MNRVFRMNYIKSVRERYLSAAKAEKGRILDELHKICRLNRHYAAWKIRRGQYERDAVKKKRRKARLYSACVLEVVRKVWQAAGYPWSVRLKEIVRLWGPWIDKRFHLSLEERQRLQRISPRTIDRALREMKIKNRRRIYGVIGSYRIFVFWTKHFFFRRARTRRSPSRKNDNLVRGLSQE